MHIHPSRKIVAFAASATIGLLAFIVPATQAYAGSPTIAVTPGTGTSGAIVSVSGAGWPAFDSVRVSLVQGSSTTFMCFVNANSTGTVESQTCTAPTSITQGAYTLTGSDSTLSAAAPFTLNPGITVLGFDGASAATVASGQTVGLVGSGFTANSTLKAKFNGTSVTLNPPATTTVAGQFTGTGFTVPAATPAGLYPVTVTDGSGHAATVHLTVYESTLTAAPAVGISGAVVSLSGTGWPSNDISMRVELNVGTAQNFVCFASSDGNGNLAASCTVPTGLIQGKYNLVVEDNSLAVTIPYTLNPGITALGFNGASLINAASGQTLGLAGSGFAANATLKATLNGVSAPFTAAVSTSTVGQFSGTGIVIPAATAAGRYPITVKDSSGHVGTVMVNVFAATLTATPTPGISGQTFEVNGTGWPSNDISMRVELNLGTTQNFACFASTDGNGTLAQSCTVPTGLIQGSYALVVEDNSLAVSTPFTVDPGIALFASNSTPLSSAAPGAAATVSGSGFAPNSTIVKLTIGATVVSFTTAPVTGATGSFSGGSFTVPAIAAGTYTVTTTDASGNKGTAELTVT